MSAYYNENDREKAQWIRELMKVGIVAPGEVDERSIEQVEPEDLRGFRQCHFFAGIAVWSYALRLAGWPDDREVWTGSCPCPSFSSAGKGQGFNDPRHLWPDWVRLIRQCRPSVLFGEQADDAIGFGWLDLVQAQMEAENYAVGKAVLASASVGAADLRERLYFVADSEHAERRTVVQHRENGRNGAHARRPEAHSIAGARGQICGMADSKSERCGEAGASSGRSAERTSDSGQYGELGNAGRRRLSQRERNRGVQPGAMDPQTGEAIERRGYLGGFWRDAEWIWCRDEKYRPVEPGTFPLANGATARVLKLRGYGDAINAEVAKVFIEAYIAERIKAQMNAKTKGEPR